MRFCEQLVFSSRQHAAVAALCTLAALSALPGTATAQEPPPAPATVPVAAADPRLAKLKEEALQMVQGRAKQVQEIVDML
ncbi:MAG: hypothetical protein ACOVSI_04815, partial [Gemmatimonas sp.]